MGLQKGQTNNRAGKPRGAKNKVGKGLREKITLFLEGNWPDMEVNFLLLEPKDKIAFFTKLLNYAIPTLQSIQQNTILENKINKLSEAQLEKMIDQILKS